MELFPIQPLLDLGVKEGLDPQDLRAFLQGVCAAEGMALESLIEGLPTGVADQAAVHLLHRHPAEVWGPYWWTSAEDAA